MLKNRPKKHSEIQSHYSDIRKYRSAILNMTEDFLNRPDMQITNELGEIFDAYSRTLIRYFKNKELEKTSSFEKEQEDEDDVMFGTIDNMPPSQPTMNSFWSGERVTKRIIIKKTYHNLVIFSLGVDFYMHLIYNLTETSKYETNPI